MVSRLHFLAGKNLHLGDEGSVVVEHLDPIVVLDSAVPSRRRDAYRRSGCRAGAATGTERRARWSEWTSARAAYSRRTDTSRSRPAVLCKPGAVRPGRGTTDGRCRIAAARSSVRHGRLRSIWCWKGVYATPSLISLFQASSSILRNRSGCCFSCSKVMPAVSGELDMMKFAPSSADWNFPSPDHRS